VKARLEDVIVELLHAPAPAQPFSGNGATGRKRPRWSSSSPVSRRWVEDLYRKEVKRFLRVPGQTILSPLITTRLLLRRLRLVPGSPLREVEGVPYRALPRAGPGHARVINNAFLNTSSSMFIMKAAGTIVDLLVTPPRLPGDSRAFLAAAATRAMLVGGPHLAHRRVFRRSRRAASHRSDRRRQPRLHRLRRGGLIVALWADKFEQVNFSPPS